jgi:hypothetical protein
LVKQLADVFIACGQRVGFYGFHDGFSHRDGHDGIVRYKTYVGKNFKVLAAVVVKLKTRSCDVAYDGSQHANTSSST